MHDEVAKALDRYGVDSVPDFVHLAVGRPVAAKLLGAQTLKALAASRKYPGDRRAKPRAQWCPYVVPRPDGTYVVTCPDPAALPHQSWRALPGIYAAAAHVAYLAQHGGPWTPPPIVYSLDEWEPPESGVVAVDIEGQRGQVDRIGLATADSVVSVQWDQRAGGVWDELAANPDLTLVAHNAPFDAYGLANETGAEPYIDCALVASKLVNPWHPVGLGKCVGLYVPGVMPWKHKAEEDPEFYNAMDVAVLPTMWQTLRDTIYARHMERAYAADIAAAYALFDWELRHDDRVSNTVNWELTGLTKAAGILETGRQEGHNGVPHHIDFWGIVSQLIGADLVLPEDSAIHRRHVLGFGPRQIRNGAAEFPAPPHLPAKCKDNCVKEITAAFDAANPAFVTWANRVRRQARKDGYIAAADGRRFYGARGGEAQRFVILSEIARRQKAVLHLDPLRINHAAVVLRSASTEALELLR